MYISFYICVYIYICIYVTAKFQIKYWGQFCLSSLPTIKPPFRTRADISARLSESLGLS